MWIGVLWMDEDDRDPTAPDVEQLLLAYEPHRIFVAGGPLDGLAQAALNLRAGMLEPRPGRCEAPRCGHCGADLGMPDLDGFDAEWAACASS